ncbi:MAG: hypothetical protein M0Z33_01710 [Actinomycetota bacterium]|nr:hypothetical protein [Actinomycetota bacterium]
MADERPLVDQVLDLVVYAPLGAALTVAEHLPDLVAKGRARVETRVSVARMVGRLGVAEMRRRLEDDLAEADDTGPDTSGGRPSGGAAGPRRHEPVPSAGDTARSAAPDARELAIPGYDSLAASQVVRRLTALSADELDAVARYEEGNRQRRTILGRIAQLRGDGGARA